MRDGRRAGSMTVGHLGDTPRWRKGMTDRLIIFVQSFGQRLCAEGTWEMSGSLVSGIVNITPFAPRTEQH